MSNTITIHASQIVTSPVRKQRERWAIPNGDGTYQFLPVGKPGAEVKAKRVRVVIQKDGKVDPAVTVVA